jgi:hypothetical protein
MNRLDALKARVAALSIEDAQNNVKNATLRDIERLVAVVEAVKPLALGTGGIVHLNEVEKALAYWLEEEP